MLRIGSFGEDPIIIENIYDFEMNLNKRFCFHLIRKWINFSCFVLAGGVVLTSLLINAFDSTNQDLDFFGLTLGFYQAIATRTFINYKLTRNIYDVDLYIDRCFKYYFRGFTWLCPMDYDDLMAQKPVVSASKTIDYGFNDFYFNADSFEVQKASLDLYPFINNK
ncbi:unnamed protein product [Rotaria magnacalcarata]|uniref:Uncharacterized protein n=1 Tax=Rotaria magnacalcarata TaxID=392030 RepID=A0A819ZLG4_9BILA|nr:unnamed protein product [Rotaria magnacalcarata]